MSSLQQYASRPVAALGGEVNGADVLALLPLIVLGRHFGARHGCDCCPPQPRLHAGLDTHRSGRGLWLHLDCRAGCTTPRHPIADNRQLFAVSISAC